MSATGGQPRARAASRTGMRRGTFACGLGLAWALAQPMVVAYADTPAPRPKPARGGERLVVDRVVAVVNDSIILASELQTRLLVLMPDLAAITDPQERVRRVQKLTRQALDEMVNDELMVQAAEAARIEVEASEIDAALEEIRTSNNLDQAGLAAALAEQGFTIPGYKVDLRRQLLRLRAVNQLVTPKVNVSEDQVRARYDELSRRTESVSAVRLAQILIALPEQPTEQQLADARARAAEAIARVQRGEDFAAVAAEISDDESTRAGGGELGWFERGALPAAWEQIAFAMEQGDVRGPVEGPQGLHVFRAVEVKRTDLKPYEQMRDGLRAELRRRDLDRQTAQWVEDLRRQAYIDIKAGLDG
ncbi:MAG: peptidylprolyl isomerase [Kofleriaceae bacterium]